MDTNNHQAKRSSDRKPSDGGAPKPPIAPKPNAGCSAGKSLTTIRRVKELMQRFEQGEKAEELQTSGGQSVANNSQQVDVESDEDEQWQTSSVINTNLQDSPLQKTITKPIIDFDSSSSTTTSITTPKRAITVVGTVQQIMDKISQFHNAKHGGGRFLNDVSCGCAHRLSLLTQLRVLNKTHCLLKTEIELSSADVDTYSDLAATDEDFTLEKDTLSKAYDSMLQLKSQYMDTIYTVSVLYLEHYQDDYLPTDGDVLMDFNNSADKIVFA